MCIHQVYSTFRSDTYLYNKELKEGPAKYFNKHLAVTHIFIVGKAFFHQVCLEEPSSEKMPQNPVLCCPLTESYRESGGLTCGSSSLADKQCRNDMNRECSLGQCWRGLANKGLNPTLSSQKSFLDEIGPFGPRSWFHCSNAKDWSGPISPGLTAAADTSSNGSFLAGVAPLGGLPHRVAKPAYRLPPELNKVLTQTDWGGPWIPVGHLDRKQVYNVRKSSRPSKKQVRAPPSLPTILRNLWVLQEGSAEGFTS